MGLILDILEVLYIHERGKFGDLQYSLLGITRFFGLPYFPFRQTSPDSKISSPHA